VMALLHTTFAGARVGSTSPASYMVQVPHAGWCTGGYHHDLLRRRGLDPLEHLRQDSALAVQHGLRYVANLNACTNPLDNRTFFEVYLALARLPDVHFLTSWQWEQGRYPQPSFEQRLRDPQVQDLVRALPRLIAEWTAGREIPAAFLAAHGLRYRLEVVADPRPLRLHVLEIDLGAPHIEVAAALTPDPDGEGPAEGALESPLALAQRTGALALVNANPWRGLPDADGNRSSQWLSGMPVDILGLVKSAEGSPSPAEPGYCAVWIDDSGVAHIGPPPPEAVIRTGLAGFSQVLQEGQVLAQPDAVCHPRTGLGVDATGKKLLLVVVDGRQPGFSEGMTLHELGAFLLGQGCRDAVNLDGGGSSILILTDAEGEPHVINAPSTKLFGASIPRPLPVALIVRSKE
ncbi:MAG: phosphodiester glycosidase family protein, partial [candidate division WS1 bacterium]|nr:phosphodiester glycosidase family protein [candidate division WS1 bacterium]